MPQGGTVVLLAALAVAGAYYGGKAAYTHVLRPAGCAVSKVATLGRKGCSLRSTVAKPSPGQVEPKGVASGRQ